MQKHPAKVRIGLLRELTNGNLGNAALEAAVVQHLLEYFPGAQIYVSCIDSLSTLRCHDVQLFPLTRRAYNLSRQSEKSGQSSPSPTSQPAARWRIWLKTISILVELVKAGRAAHLKTRQLAAEWVFWARSYHFIKGFHLLIVCGGGQLSDWWGGPWGHPYVLFMWAWLARLTRTRLVVLDVGAEDVTSILGRWFLKSMLKSASYRSYRDESTRKTVAAWGIVDENHVYPDPAFSLKISTPRRSDGSASNRRLTVGISPMAYCDPRVWPIKDAAVYRRYLGVLASFTCDLARQGCVIHLFASQVRMDVGALEDFKALVSEEDPTIAAQILEPGPQTVDDYLSLMPKLDIVVASRMHGVLLAQLMCTPTIAVSYESKIDALMSAFGLEEFCLSISDVDKHSLVSRIALLQSKREAVSDAIEQRLVKYRTALEDQYAEVFGS